MSIKETIRQEIERLIGSVNEKQDANPAMPKYRWHMYEGMKEAFMDMKDFIDSLPECEETAKISPEKYEEELNEEIQGFIDEYGYERGEDKILIAIVARHFVEWAKHKESLQVPETCKENQDSFTSLEEAAEEYALLFDDGTRWKDGGKYKGFIAGAEWQKEQMYKQAEKSLLKKSNGEYLLEDLVAHDIGFHNGRKIGAEEARKQMMKDAVEGFIFQSEEYYPKELVAQYNGELKHGDKVKIIILPSNDAD